jgi:hypothetical protein
MSQPETHSESHRRTAGIGFVSGAVLLFLFTAGVLRGFGMEGDGVLVVGALVGLVAGGSLGVAMTRHHEHLRHTVAGHTVSGVS